jgi:signal transduction histidine kinase
MILTQAASILLTTEGTLAYHLIIITTLGLALVMGRAARSGSSRRDLSSWELALLGVLFLRLALMAYTAFTWAGNLNSTVVLPALDRFVSLSSFGLLAWGLFHPGENQRWDIGLLAGLAITAAALLATVVFTSSGITPYFNRTVSDALWTVAGFMLCVLLVGWLVIKRIDQRSLPILGFGTLAVGYALHLTLGPSDASFPAILRWAELAAYPLLSMGGVSLAIGRIRTQAQRKPVSRSDQEARFLPEILHETTSILESTSQDILARGAVESVARSMKSELCFLITPPDPSGYLSVAAAYDLISEKFIEGETYTDDELPVLAQALKRKQPLVLPGGTKIPDAQVLRTSLGLAQTGPILMAPISYNGELVGGLVLLSPYARSRWSNVSMEAVKSFGQLIGRRFSQLRKQERNLHAAMTSPNANLEETRKEVERLLQENNELTDQLLEATDRAGQDLAGFLQNHSLARETISLLESEIDRMKDFVAEPTEPSENDQIAQLSYELQHSLQELSEARTQLALLDALPDGRLPVIEESGDLKRLAHLAQDLRQPMASIVGYTDLLLDELESIPDHDASLYVDHIRESTDRLTNLLNQLIHLAAIETGSLEVLPTSLDLAYWIDDSLEQVEPAMERRALHLRKRIPQNVPRVMADPDAISQVLIHLLNNAVGASPEGGVVGIGLRIAEADATGFLTLRISDEGRGIPASDLHRVFDPGYPPEGPPLMGLGEEPIGLSIMKTLIEAMGGRIWIESKENFGTTFVVLLPLAEDKDAKNEKLLAQM